MSNSQHNNYKLPKKVGKNPFSVPEDYFSTLSSRISEKIEGLSESNISEEDNRQNISLWNRVRPHLALAAVIAGFALISVSALQFILGDKNIQQGYYDLSLLDAAGILDESTLQESLDFGEEDTYTEWEEDAISYLASNEMDLYLLLDEN